MNLLLKAAHCSEILVSTKKATEGYKTEDVIKNDQYRKQYKKKVSILCTVSLRSADNFVTKKGGPPS